jgi:ABC-type multidrug transport system fused ATPase/permease subunit
MVEPLAPLAAQPIGTASTGMPSLRHFRSALRILFLDMDRTVAWRLGTTNLLAVAGGLFAGLAPLALKTMIDALSGPQGTPGQRFTVTVSGAAYLFWLCAGRLFGEIRTVLTSAAEQRLFSKLRKRFFEHLLALPLAFHLERPGGSLVHTLQHAISGYQVVMASFVNSVIPVLVELATVALVLVSLNQPALMLSFATTAMAYGIALSLGSSGVSVAARAVSSASVDAHRLLADGLINVEPIKCFGSERWMLDGFGSAARCLEQRWAQLQHQRLRMGLTVSVIFVLSQAASLLIALHELAQGAMNVGGFVLVNVYALQLVRPFEMLGSAVRDVSQGLAFIRPLIDVLETPREPNFARALVMARGDEAKRTNDAPAASHRRRQTPRVSFRGVQLAFDRGRPVLNGFTLDIPAGRSIGIVGASGCGKSSVVRLLLRLYEPQAGCIELDDIDLKDLPVAALRAMVAVVPQDVVLLNSTITENIGMGKEGISQKMIVNAARLANMHDFITALPHGYHTEIGERGLRLSGGERQRIALARAITRDPLVYVFDEATSMLDGPSETAILRDLSAISAGRTTITIAHRLSALRHVDEIAVLAAGQVAEQGNHAALLALGGLYAAMWRTQHQG